MVRPDSAGRPDHTESVPTELLLRTLSSLSFDELLPLLAVNRRWRNIAIDSTPYWSFIELKSLSAAAIGLFFTRISRAKERPLALDVNLDLGDDAASQSAALQAAVLSTLRDHLRHILKLTVYLRRSDAPALWNALDVAAPQLRFLYLRNTLLRDRGPLALPSSNLFAGNAPVLGSVVLVGVDLPEHPLPAFSQVTKLEIRYGSAVPDVFLHFPALETVGFPIGASFDHQAFHTARSYRNIKKCVWGSGRGRSDAPLPLAPTRDVEFVSIYSPRAEEMVELVGHLRAPISLTYRPCPDYPTQEFELLFLEVDATPTRSRLIIDVVEAWLGEVYPELQPALCTALAGRLHTLEIDAAHWETFVRCMPAVLSGVQRVRITVPDEGTITALPRVKVAISGLRTLELVAARCMWISEDDLIDFAVATHDGPAMAPSLVLYNIHIGESVLGLGFFFKDVQLVHSAACSP